MCVCVCEKSGYSYLYDTECFRGHAVICPCVIKEILCEDNTILWISKLYSGVSVRYGFGPNGMENDTYILDLKKSETTGTAVESIIIKT